MLLHVNSRSIFTYLFLLTGLLFFQPGNAQDQLLQGEWRDHLSYRRCFRLAEVGDRMFCSTESGLIAYDKSSMELQTYSKVTGLSDVLISSIAYSEETDYLIIGYTNGNIDLFREGESPLNISDIERRIMTADKSINQIYVMGSTAYLACGFGVVVVNLAKQEIKETYILGESGAYIAVNDIAILNNTLFAATESGIFRADLDSPNLLDFNSWSQLSFIPQYNKPYKAVEAFNNKLFAVYTLGDTVPDVIITFTPEADTYTEWDKTYDSPVMDLTSSNGFLTISNPSQGFVYNENELLIHDIVSYNNQQIFVASDNTVYIASNYSGFLQVNDDGSLRYLLINGPRYSEVSKISTQDNMIWVSSGGPTRLYYHGGINYMGSDRIWHSLTSENIPTEKPLGNTYKIAIDPKDPEHVYLATYGYGIIEIRQGEVEHIYELGNTEAFEGISELVDIRVAGIQFDPDGNLYFLIGLEPDPLFKLDTEGNLTRLDYIDNSLLQKQNIAYSDLLITSRGQIWIISRASGIVVLEDEGDGYFRSKNFLVRNQFDNVLSQVFCASEDKDGNIWVGTNNGPVIYYSPWNIFQLSEVSGYQVPIPRNDGTNIVDPLLYSESIFDITVDGGNRKWMATDQSGVFLISEDGKKTLANYTAENSPLLSNGVTGIGINELSGEVFFATDLGLVSFGGSSIEGLRTYDNVYVYPNPIRPDYEGPITITNLMANSIVKITDISGNLVWQTRSLGGQAIWDGRNFNGDRVATGVYLIMLATENGEQSHISKLLFLH